MSIAYYDSPSVSYDSLSVDYDGDLSLDPLRLISSSKYVRIDTPRPFARLEESRIFVRIPTA